ncbi:hypothetical protein [Halogranum rubrum]|uniref:Halo transducer protein n=1 Tax=Halogranum salarium B-1 TaxID=1210908 RepID=J3ESY2_9EURY|nr:hypothetical protein [Halogranum salarium]EJN57122.1 hypothetical protein HSB1_45080 [Halogranum salarium B-1]
MNDDDPTRPLDVDDESSYVVAQVRGERIEVAASVLDELGGVAADDGMTAEAWLERNIGPSILYGTIVQLVDEFTTFELDAADDEGVAPMVQVATWRATLDESRAAAADVWGDPTLAYADQVRDAATRLDGLLETVETSLVALDEQRRRHGADHELVGELAENVDRQVELLHRVAEAMTE